MGMCLLPFIAVSRGLRLFLIMNKRLQFQDVNEKLLQASCLQICKKISKKN